jgi:hypothetical protein
MTTSSTHLQTLPGCKSPVMNETLKGFERLGFAFVQEVQVQDDQRIPTYRNDSIAKLASTDLIKIGWIKGVAN